MLESFIVMLREGIEVALIVGLIWIYLRETGRQKLIPAVLWGLGAGVVASLALAWGLASLDWSKPFVEGTMMFVAAAFVGTMVAGMMLHARTMGRSIRKKIDTIATTAEKPSITAFAGIIAFTAIMVAREGFETVVMLKAVDLGTGDSAMSLIGTLAGLALAIAFAVMFIRGAVRIDLGRFFKITGLVLAIFLVQLVIYGMHEYGEVGLMNWLPASVMQVIDAIAKANLFFILAIVAIPLLILVVPGKNREVKPKVRGFRMAGATAGLVIVAILGVNYIATHAHATSAGLPVLHPERGYVEIELDHIAPQTPSAFVVPEDDERFTLVVWIDASGKPFIAVGELELDEVKPNTFRFDAGAISFIDPEDGDVHAMRSVPCRVEGKDVYVAVEAIEMAAEQH
jgi:FTR1 family protein